MLGDHLHQQVVQHHYFIMMKHHIPWVSAADKASWELWCNNPCFTHGCIIYLHTWGQNFRSYYFSLSDKLIFFAPAKHYGCVGFLIWTYVTTQEVNKPDESVVIKTLTRPPIECRDSSCRLNVFLFYLYTHSGGKCLHDRTPFYMLHCARDVFCKVAAG